MDLKLTQKQVGKRIMDLRKRKGWSQEELADSIGLSRSSLVQVEAGRRGIDIFEMLRLSHLLEFSLDEFLAPDYQIEILHFEKPKPPQKKEEAKLRVSVPTLHLEKFRNILLYILERCAGKPNVGETVLYKLLYFCDFNYYEMYEEHLTGSEYRKLPYGPVPQKLDAIIEQMMKDGQLQRIKTEYHKFPQTRYLPLVKADLRELSAAEKTVIDEVIQQMSDWSARAISDYSHKDIPWMVSKDAEIINYELAFYREAPFSVRNYAEMDVDA